MHHLSSDIAGTHVASPLQIVLSVVNGDPETLAFFPTAVPSLWTLAMNRGAYYHVVFTFDPAIDRVERFLNGVSRGQRTNADQFSEPGLYTIGQIFSGDHFWGRMDERPSTTTS